MPKIIYISCFLLLLSCSKNQSSSSSVQASSYSYKSNNSANPSQPQDPARDRFSVEPEIAIMNAAINATASSFDEVSQLLTTNSEKLINSVAKVEGCSANITDYQHPVAYNSSRKIASSNTQKYSSSIELEVVTDFAQSKNIQGRIKQLNSCLQAVPKLKVEESSETENQSINLLLSKAMPTVKNAGKYRQQLLKTKFVALQEVAEFSEPPTQFKALDTACTSQGNVKIVDRSLKEIELDIDLDCRRLVNNKAVVVEQNKN